MSHHVLIAKNSNFTVPAPTVYIFVLTSHLLEDVLQSPTVVSVIRTLHGRTHVIKLVEMDRIFFPSHRDELRGIISVTFRKQLLQ